MLEVVASPTIVILMTLEVSFMLLANIYSRGITHDHNIFIVQATGIHIDNCFLQNCPSYYYYYLYSLVGSEWPGQ